MSYDKKRNLGRGLAALISEATTSYVHAQNEASGSGLNIVKLPLNMISFNIEQPRKYIDPERLQELANTVREHGILQPIVVKKIADGSYQIVIGERRFHAAKMAGLDEIPVIVKEISDSDSFEIAVIENIQRQKLSVFEEAEAYKKLMEDYAHTQESLAQKMGKSRSYVANTMRLLRLPNQVKEMLANNALSPGHARALVNCEDPLTVAQKVLRDNLSVRATEELVRLLDRDNVLAIGDIAEGKNDKNAKKKHNTVSQGEQSETLMEKDIIYMQDILSNSLAAKVTIDIREKKSKIIIKCDALDKLDRIIAKLSEVSEEILD